PRLAGVAQLRDEGLAVDVAAAKERPAQRLGRGADQLAGSRAAGVLNLEQVRSGSGEVSRCGDGEFAEGGRVLALVLALQAVGLRLDDQRQPVPVAIRGRGGDQLPLLGGAGLVIGAVVKEELAALGSEPGGI